MSLETRDAESEPPSTIGRMESKIVRTIYLTGKDAALASPQGTGNISNSELDHLETVTICIVVMQNGFTVIGKAVPGSIRHFDATMGRKYAYENAIRQLLKLESRAF